MSLSYPHVLAAMLAAFLWPAASPAQGPDGTIGGTGLVTLYRKPDLLRMEVPLNADGKDPREALARLKEQQASLRTQIVALGATESTIHFADPRIVVARDDRQARMEQMMRARLAKKGSATSKPAAPPVSIATTLKAEWSLKAQNAEELLLASHELQQKIKEKISPKKAKTASAAEEEAEEEGNRDPMGYDDGSPKPGEPIFMFVSKISDEEQARATADAFKKAREDAQRLAKAAGAELGSLRHVSSQAGDDPEQYSDYGPSYRRQLYMMQRVRTAQGEAKEAVGMDPTSVRAMIVVSASFALK